MKKIYLAGPDVFRENALEFFKSVKSLVISYGFIPLAPLDNVIPFEEGESNKPESADKIFKANIQLINEADIVLANVVPFRGVCIDDGTAFEIGYAFAAKKLIYGYGDDCDILLKEKTEKHFLYASPSHFPVIEDFGYCSNLMICSSIKLSGGKILKSIDECLVELSKWEC